MKIKKLPSGELVLASNHLPLIMHTAEGVGGKEELNLILPAGVTLFVMAANSELELTSELRGGSITNRKLLLSVEAKPVPSSEKP